MADSTRLFATNVAVLRARAGRHAYYGLGIALVAVAVATVITSLMQSGEISVSSLFAAQRDNFSLWVIDLMPFAFAFWGQYVSLVMAHEAGALVLDQTQELRARNTALEVQAVRETTHDSLTGLPNRAMFLERLEHALEQAHHDGRNLGMLVLDLDGFKEVNEVLGQHNGDRVLKSVARRLLNSVSDQVTVARLGADTFAVLLPHAGGREDLIAIARRINKALEPPCALENLTINLHASSGGALAPNDAVDSDSLLNCADTAMHEAKQTGGHFVLFKPRHQDADPHMLSLTAELRTAIEQDQFVLFLQPIVACNGEGVVGTEALVRWQHPRRGLLPPSEFVARAERSGLIVELSRWVLQRALTHAQEFTRQGWPLRMSVNLSARAMLDPDFPDVLADLLAAHKLDGDRLILEITENTLMSDQRRSLDVVGRVARLGVQIAIDDFGTGYSQLAYLKRLPVTEIKIDRSFIQDMLDSKTDQSIVQATIGLAHALDLRVVGEGVENERQERKLTELGCDMIQGYYVGRPMPADALLDWLEEWRGWHRDSPPGRPYPVV